MIEDFQTHIKYITNRGFKPIFNIIDNVASEAITVYLREENIKVQLVEPHNNQVNASERAIQTFKNNFIAGLSIVDEKFPTIIWSYLIRYTQKSLNLLRTSRVHPQLLAYQLLEVTHEFNRHPWDLPETR